jgi:ABC-type multidrug transport system fused ATPase/permease subunit
LLLAYLLRAGTTYIVTRYGHELGVRVEADMREDIFRKVQSLSFSFFDKNRTGKLMSRMTTDLNEITELAHHGPENLLQAGLTLIGALIILLTIRWELALILFAMLSGDAAVRAVAAAAACGGALWASSRRWRRSTPRWNGRLRGAHGEGLCRAETGGKGQIRRRPTSASR